MMNSLKSNQKKSRSSVYLLGVRIDSTSKEKLLNTVQHIVSRKSYNTIFTIFTPNPEQLVLAQSNDHFRSTLNQSSLNLPDGMGLLWADRLLSKQLGQSPTLTHRVTGVDSIQALIGILLSQEVPSFLLGGGQHSARQAVEFLINNRAQSLRHIPPEKLSQLLASHPGSAEISQESQLQRNSIIAEIKNHGTKVLFVAYGAPWQEQWVMANRDQLTAAGVRVVMVVGGAFDMLAGNVVRAPLKWQNSGFEWLWRLLHQPWRWKRQMSLIKFSYAIFRSMLVAGLK